MSYSKNTIINTNTPCPHPEHSVRADFAGGGLSSDLGPVLLRSVDFQACLTKRIAVTVPDRRHQSYIDHSYHDLLAQRIYQIACGYDDGNDSNCKPI